MIVVNIAGDFAPFKEEFYKNEKFADIVQANNNCDYSIVNLECPIVVNSNATPINKCGPCLKTGEFAVKLLKKMSFDCVTISNNHIYDYGEQGVKDTLDTLERYGVQHVGGGINLNDASKTLYVKIKGESIAIINCSEHEFSTASDNKAGSNPLDLVSLFYQINKAKEKAKNLIIIVHGGIEGFFYPSPRMIKTYRYLIDIGADAVINHHQHCYSGYEIYHDKPIFYGLGNFLFHTGNKSSYLWNTGYMVRLSLDVNKIDFEIIPFGQKNFIPNVERLKEEEEKLFFDRLNTINSIINDTEKLQKTYNQLLRRPNSVNVGIITPYSSKWLLAAHSKGWLPSLVNKKKLLIWQNRIECESHRERLLYYIKSKLAK